MTTRHFSLIDHLFHFLAFPFFLFISVSSTPGILANFIIEVSEQCVENLNLRTPVEIRDFGRSTNRDLKQQRQRRQRQRQKAIGYTFARASRFFVHFSAVVARLQLEVPNSTFCRGRQRKTTTFIVFSFTKPQWIFAEYYSRQK